MITSRNNPAVQDACRLHQKKYRDETSLFLIEGTKLLNEAVRGGADIVEIFATPEWLEAGAGETGTLNVTEVSKPVIEKICTMRAPEGVAAVVKKSISKSHAARSYVILEDIQDPGNLGTIIRTADAAGYEAVLCSEGCADLYNEKVLRASMGSVFHLPVLRLTDLIQEASALRAQGVTLIATDLHGWELNLRDVQIPERFGLVFGNESKGISSKLLETCSERVKIPIYGKAESLNVAVAAGILLYAYAD